MPETPAIPRRRFFTQADGRINWRECMLAARQFRTELERSHRFAIRSALGITRADIRDIGTRVNSLMLPELEAWDALSPSIRAAATHFDASMDLLGTTCICDVSRREAIKALAENRPALWDAGDRTPNGDWAIMLNHGADRRCYEDTETTVFEALIAHHSDTPIKSLRPLNEAGAALIRNARAARAMRGRPVAA